MSSSLLSKNIKIKTHRTIFLPVVFYGYEIWSLTLREERRLRVFENWVLWRIFGSERDDVTGEWKKLHNEELNNLYSSPNIFRVMKSRRMGWAGRVARIGEKRVHTGLWCGNLREREHLEDRGVDGRIIIRWILRKNDFLLIIYTYIYTYSYICDIDNDKCRRGVYVQYAYVNILY